MRTSLFASLTSVLVGLCFVPGPTPPQDEPPIDETRLTIHTLIREDIFAGWRSNNMERFERGERNLETLLETRPESRADLLAWKAGTTLYRAILAHEDGREDEFQTLYQQTLELIDQSRDADSESVGAVSVIGGSFSMFADRLPESVRDDAWEQCYASFKALHEMQSDYIEHLPPHMMGELLGGLTQSSHRTGRMDEYEMYRDQIIDALPNTGYSRVALKWKEDPEAATTENISCKSCHAEGRLSAKLAELNDD